MHTSTSLGLLASMALAVLLVGCGSPDPEQTGFVLLDEEARAAGIVVETNGERHDRALPIAVDPGETAFVDGPGIHETLQVSPEEVVEIRGARGEIVRNQATNRLVISASSSGATTLAEMLDAQLHRRHDGRYELQGENLLLIASMLDGVPEILGASALAPTDWVFDPNGTLTPDMPKVGMDAPRLDDTAVAEGPSLDPASVVGVYRAASLTMILDAAGGYRTLVGPNVVQKGSWKVLGRSVQLQPADGSQTSRIGVTSDSVFDATGVEFFAHVRGGAL